MDKRKLRAALAFIALIGLFMAAWRFVPGLARAWHTAAALPLILRLHRLTAKLPYPAIELIAPVCATLIILLPLLGRRRRALAVALAFCLCAGYGLLWYPAYFTAPADAFPVPDARQIEALCERLSNVLTASPMRFPTASDAAATAPATAGMPEARVKPARFPEWMAALRLSGVFVPWTAEVVVAPDAHPAFIPFTCVHELMHLRGIADEGEANIAAYRRCTASGGAFADSARLWALRYALAALARTDDSAFHRAIARLRPDMAALLTASAGDLYTPPGPLAALLGIADACSDYDALIGWLIAHPGLL